MSERPIIRPVLPPHPFTLICVRHAESKANAARGKAHEHGTDTRLSARGKEQAQRLAEPLRALKITHAGSSDLVRAMETLEGLGPALEGAAILPPSPKLRELSRGDDAASGFPLALRQRMNVMRGTFYRSPNGQSMADVATLYYEWALDTAIAIQLGEHGPPPQDLRLLMVGHGNGIKALFAGVTGCDMSALGELRNTSLTLLRYDPRRLDEARGPFYALTYNDAPHLGTGLETFHF